MAVELTTTPRPLAAPRQRGPLVTGFSGAATSDVEAVADHLNGNHADTVLLIARFVGRQHDAGSAEITRVDPDGLEVAVWFSDGAWTAVHLHFDVELYAVEALRERLLTLVQRARRAAGAAEPITSFEEAVASTTDLATFVTEVVAVEDLNPGLRQLTVAGGPRGEGLDGFRSLGGDQFLYVITGDPSGRPLGPGFTMERLAAVPVADRPPAAYYTVRRWRPATAELDLWFVLHHHDRGVSGWASRAAPGDRVALWGPRRSYDPPATATSRLLVADETGLAAVAAILEELPPGVPAHALIEVADGGDVDLPSGPNITTEWVLRTDGEPGTGTRLLDAVRDLDLDADGVHVFGAAESRQISAVRSHLRRERGLVPEQMRMTGYWRRTPGHR